MKRGSRWPTCKKRRSDKKLLLILIRRRKLETKSIHLARGMGSGIHAIMSAPRRGAVAVLQCSVQIRWRDTPFGQGLTSREPGCVLGQLGEAYKRRIQQDVLVTTPRLTDLGQDLGFPDPQLLPSVRTPVFAPGVERRGPSHCLLFDLGDREGVRGLPYGLTVILHEDLEAGDDRGQARRLGGIKCQRLDRSQIQILPRFPVI
jgi:hypothetical protein